MMPCRLPPSDAIAASVRMMAPRAHGKARAEVDQRRFRSRAAVREHRDEGELDEEVEQRGGADRQ
jgi:hypothetical protein